MSVESGYGRFSNATISGSGVDSLRYLELLGHGSVRQDAHAAGRLEHPLVEGLERHLAVLGRLEGGKEPCKVDLAGDILLEPLEDNANLRKVERAGPETRG